VRARRQRVSPATMEHFKRYVMVLLPAAAVLWIAAKAIGNHLLR